MSPVKLLECFLWWLVPIAAIVMTNSLELGSSPIWMIAFAGFVFLVEGLRELRGMRDALKRKGSGNQ